MGAQRRRRRPVHEPLAVERDGKGGEAQALRRSRAAAPGGCRAPPSARPRPPRTRPARARPGRLPRRARDSQVARSSTANRASSSGVSSSGSRPGRRCSRSADRPRALARPIASTRAANSRSFAAATISPPSAVERLVRRDRRELRAAAGRHGACAEEAGEVVGHEPERRLVQGHVHLATLAGSLTLVQRRDDAERRPHARALVGDRDACADAGRPASPVTLMIPPAACASGS